MQMNRITLTLENIVMLYQITAKELSDVLHLHWIQLLMNLLALLVHFDTDLCSDVWVRAVSLQSSVAETPWIRLVTAVGLALAAEPVELCALMNVGLS